jgi:putative endopeptidase
VQSLRDVLRDRIDAREWMSERTREQALAKLASFNQKIGYPDRWQDYATLEVLSDSYAANVQARACASGEARSRARRQAGGPRPVADDGADGERVLQRVAERDRLSGGTAAAALLLDTYDDPANYGGIGATIGHELSHGFDDSGRKYDAAGNVRDWWTPEDARRYGERAGVVERQYGSYVVIDTLRLNGR